MSREDIIRMAREAKGHAYTNRHLPGEPAFAFSIDRLVHFAELVAAAERKTMMQLFADPENQPSQYGTVTLEYMEREIEAEREACEKVCGAVSNLVGAIESVGVPNVGARKVLNKACEDALKCVDSIRARGNK